ncbi:hypothetical protein OSJ77_13090 [Phyllobacterium sp. 0TCS1.6C]|uniref:hypothetical protein n=1 Tax=unclassified Phyllobacterium TaxID=2638441 RepID=UPI002263DB60|nr:MULTISPECIES: hypothetical protein [unclassified Phyllobacterium]MCX8281129.1 hypothetical protein [Phyllobacterium sp. 0TCS1.6C]MCX8294584.1 hypothetical protein [Phyllobacterium sp. 0TCS1.6A]
MVLLNYLTRIQFGFGSLALLKGKCDILGMRRPLIVADAGVHKADIPDPALEQLSPQTVVTVFDATPPSRNDVLLPAAFNNDGASAVQEQKIERLAHVTGIARTPEIDIQHQSAPSLAGRSGSPLYRPAGATEAHLRAYNKKT